MGNSYWKQNDQLVRMMEALSIELKQWRVDRGVSQRAAAKMTRAEQSWFSAVERGGILVSLDTLQKLTDLPGLDLSITIVNGNIKFNFQK